MDTIPTADTDTLSLSAEQSVPRSNVSNAPKAAVHQTLYSADGCAQYDYPVQKKQLPPIAAAGEGQTNWLHFVGINDCDLLKQTLAPFGIHELVVEDILSRKQRPKIEDYGTYVFIAAQVYHYGAQKLHSDQVYLIIGKNFVLSFQQKPLGLFSRFRETISCNPHQLWQKNTAFLAYCLLDRIVDDYFVVANEYGNRVEAIDKALFKQNNDDILGRIHLLKRDAVRLRRSLTPMKDIFYRLAERNEFAIFSGEPAVYLRDVYDHSLQLIESLDAAWDMVVGMMDVYLSFQSNRMNQQMRVLTVITILFMPLTLITGIYGMNFENMPELHWHYGYFMVLGIMALIIVVLLVFFYRRKWL
ncbi:magnesium/cobalt transporter CorA [Neisseria perflava]|uniref:magnesium/cobalt transporter CorA n=1 Tax=Neisseria perflava TaxID=33053 RepID=UPI00209D9D6F|nr:magnesium/cobalt transporter CorA [Neisseria perflava]MCP1660800.1 magnesium transporter [Neisseria perflava]MCP1773420.1 magnesium transporter [Neisseria perflava]